MARNREVKLLEVAEEKVKILTISLAITGNALFYTLVENDDL